MRHECWSILIPVLYSPLTIKLSLVQYLSSNKDRRLGDRTPQADLSKPKPRQLVVGRVQVDQSARAFQPWKTCRKPSEGLPWVTPRKSPFSKGQIHDSPDSVCTILYASLIMFRTLPYPTHSNHDFLGGWWFANVCHDHPQWTRKTRTRP